jgi:hypothetical protein
LESKELGSNTAINSEYSGICGSLREYLSDELRKLVAGIEESNSLWKKTWDAAQIAGIKIQSIQKEGKTQGNSKTVAKFKNITDKWGAKR